MGGSGITWIDRTAKPISERLTALCRRQLERRHRVRQAVLEMYGLIGKMTSKPGERDALVALMLQAAENMPGCLSYIIARDTGDENAVWITEVWEDEASHQASLQLPSVRDAIAKAMPLIAGIEPGIITDPVAMSACLPARIDEVDQVQHRILQKDAG